MTKNGNSLDQRTFDKLSRLYIIALSTIALSVIISQILIRKHLDDQQSDSTVINVAGRQRMLSQKLTKDHVEQVSFWLTLLKMFYLRLQNFLQNQVAIKKLTARTAAATHRSRPKLLRIISPRSGLPSKTACR